MNSQNPLAGATPFRTREEREADRLQKREAVLRAAVRMFNQRGFHATSLDDVAASLGISKPTIYHYLGNKDQVLLECVTRGLDQLKQAADEAEGATGSGLDRLRGFLRHYAELNMADFGRCVIRTGDEALSPESARQFRALKSEVDKAMRRLIAEGMQDGTIAPGNVTLVAFTLAGALNWPARWHDPDKKGSSAGELADQLVDILISGIQPRG